MGDPGSIPGSGRSPGEGNGNPLQYSCLENPMDGGAWQATVHGVAKSRTWLSDFTFTFKRLFSSSSLSTIRVVKVKVKSLSHVRLFTTPWTAACQAPPSMGFSRQEYWSGLPLPTICIFEVVDIPLGNLFNFYLFGFLFLFIWLFIFIYLFEF